MRLLVAVAVTSITMACVTPTTPPPTGAQGAEPVSVAFYLIHEAPGEGLIERKVESTGETIFVSTKPDLTNSDIGWATVQLDYIRRRANVLIHLTPIGTEKLATLTSENIGKRLAIVIDGKVLSTPLIQSPMRGGRATISGFHSVDEAQRVADSLAHR